MNPSAALSIVVVNQRGLDRLSRLFACLAEQSIAGQLEVVVVSPFEASNLDPSPFACVKYVKCGAIKSLAPARALGVRACSTPYVVFGEDHCFPQPGWAEALLSRLREGWTGVGPAILNHNPATWISRADWLLNYGCFSADRESGSVAYIPPHNSAYSRAALQQLGDRLPELLQMDHNLQASLLAGGGRLFFEPRARAAHTNLSRPRYHWSTQFHGAQVYGAVRARQERWTALRRAIYAAAFPAIAILRLMRACALLKDWRELRLLPLLLIASTIAAVGEACGYLFGAGTSLLWRTDEELNRGSGITAAEQHLLLP
jgi:hypothetical protein